VPSVDGRRRLFSDVIVKAACFRCERKCLLSSNAAFEIVQAPGEDDAATCFDLEKLDRFENVRPLKPKSVRAVHFRVER